MIQTEVKAKLFDQYTQAHTTFNPKKLEASGKHFFNFGDRAQCEIFADKFMDQVESVFALHHRDYALQFFMHLSPTFLKRPKDLDRFRAIFERARESNNTSFRVAIDNEIELFESLLD